MGHVGVPPKCGETEEGGTNRENDFLEYLQTKYLHKEWKRTKNSELYFMSLSKTCLTN